MKFRRWFTRHYEFWVTFPDRFYPFAEEIEGQKVRFRAAYDQALARIQDERGFGHYGAKLIAYRSLFHLTGAIVFMFIATYISERFFGSDIALYVLFVIAALLLALQEALLQPKLLGQRRLHSVVDWLSWMVPMSIYVFMHLG